MVVVTFAECEAQPVRAMVRNSKPRQSEGGGGGNFFGRITLAGETLLAWICGPKTCCCFKPMAMTTQAKAVRPFLIRLLLRLLVIALVSGALGWLLHHSAKSVGANAQPVGFGHGVLHGALMPCALPALLVGSDLKIYAPNNTGHAYNLGYTVGVNGCGLIFFGALFWRISRWRRRNRVASPVAASGRSPVNPADLSPG